MTAFCQFSQRQVIRKDSCSCSRLDLMLCTELYHFHKALFTFSGPWSVPRPVRWLYFVISALYHFQPHTYQANATSFSDRCKRGVKLDHSFYYTCHCQPTHFSGGLLMPITNYILTTQNSSSEPSIHKVVQSSKIYRALIMLLVHYFPFAFEDPFLLCLKSKVIFLLLGLGGACTRSSTSSSSSFAIA